MNTEIVGRITTLGNDLAGFFLCLYFFSSWLNRKEFVKPSGYLGIAATAVFLIILNQVVQISEIFMLVALVTYTMVALIFYEGPIWIRLASGFFYVSLGILSELFALLFLSVFFRLPLEGIVGNPGLYVAGSLISKLLLLLMVLAFLLLAVRKAGRFSLKYWFLIASMPVFSIFITAGLFEHGVETGSGDPVMLFSAMILLYINLIAFWLFSRINEENEKIRYMEAANQQLQLQRVHFGEMLENYKATRSIWHDLRNNLLMIRGGLQAGSADDVRKHLDVLLDEVENPVAVHYTGNVAVDALLLDKIRLAERNGIQFEHELRISSGLSLPAEDLGTILGNALDNALEGCGRMVEDSRRKTIDLKILEDEGELLIYVRNSINPGEIRKVREGYLSSKRRKDVRGYGLYNMRKAVEKNRGNLVINSEGDFFELKILVPLRRPL